MSNRPLNLWLLNRVVGWDKQRLARALGPHVRLGWRRMKSMAPRHEPLGPEIFVNAEEESYPGELMHESHIGPGSTHTKYDEYFVPIPVKCVRHPRSPFWRQTATSPEAAARLDAIAMALDER